MLNLSTNPRKNAGFGMIEVLVSLVIILTGLLGLAGLLTLGQQAEMESYQRAQALVLLEDMVGRINANRKVAACYGATTTNATTGTPYLGSSATSTPACTSGTSEQNATAIADLAAWNSALIGAAETQGGSNVGAMIGARGCISLTATDTYLISVAWQGLNPTFAPSAGLGCGKDLYGSETKRRVVSTTLRIANLTAL
jgi:type IV pilus assembly protein PilV